jgi:hypothetical protein
MSQMNELRLLCEQMVQIEQRKADLEEQLVAVNKEYDHIRKERIPELMASLELRNATFEGLGRVQLAEDIYASTREGQKEAAIAWLRDTGYENMVTETYNASSLKALFRRMIEGGVPIPDEIFNVTPFTRASIVKAK